MMKRARACRVCGTETLYTGNCFSFLPVFCCESINRKRKMEHRVKKGK